MKRKKDRTDGEILYVKICESWEIYGLIRRNYSSSLRHRSKLLTWSERQYVVVLVFSPKGSEYARTCHRGKPGQRGEGDHFGASSGQYSLWLG